MAAVLERTPTCEVTGLPLPILPNEPRIIEARSSFPPNLHHTNHPKKNPFLLTVPGLAVRGCRVQRVNYALHQNYHDIFSGPEDIYPMTDDETNEFVVKCVAGVMPRRALDVSRKGRCTEVLLNRYTYELLTQPKNIFVDNKINVSKFLAEYNARQKVEKRVANIVIDEFLCSSTRLRRKNEIARDLLATALDISLIGLTPLYEDLKEEGYIRSQPETFRKVAKRMVRCYALGHYRQEVTKRLIAA